MFFAHGSNHSCGVLVLVRDSLEFEMKSIITDDNGRYILLNAEVQGSDYILGNIYAPNKIKEQCNFFVALQQKLDNFITTQDQRIIIGGDLNVIMDQNLDCAGGSPKEKESVKFLNDICLNYFKSHAIEIRFLWHRSIFKSKKLGEMCIRFVFASSRWC